MLCCLCLCCVMYEFFCSVIFIVCILFLTSFLIFFFKQKTAYEMRISDWSSDVCSSDLVVVADHVDWYEMRKIADGTDVIRKQAFDHPSMYQIGRASCRERVCQYV